MINNINLSFEINSSVCSVDWLVYFFSLLLLISSLLSLFCPNTLTPSFAIGLANRSAQDKIKGCINLRDHSKLHDIDLLFADYFPALPKSTPKQPGTCPTKYTTPCPNDHLCEHDRQCPADEKCCKHSCGFLACTKSKKTCFCLRYACIR